MGWLGRNQIATVGADGATARTYPVAPLGQNATPGVQLLRIPFDPADLNHYYTVEYRRKSGLDAGIPNDIVLTTEVKNGTSYLLRTRGGNRDPVQTLTTNLVTIRVNSLGVTASVSVTTATPRRCLRGMSGARRARVMSSASQVQRGLRQGATTLFGPAAGFLARTDRTPAGTATSGVKPFAATTCA